MRPEPTALRSRMHVSLTEPSKYPISDKDFKIRTKGKILFKIL